MSDYPGSAWPTKLAFDGLIAQRLKQSGNVAPLLKQLVQGQGQAAVFYVRQAESLLGQSLQAVSPECSVDAWQVLDLSRLEALDPYGGAIQADRWLASLCAQLQCSRQQVATHLASVRQASPASITQKQAMLSWIAGWLKSLWNLNWPHVECLIRPEADFSWRHWFVLPSERFVLLESAKDHMPAAQWFIWRALHDGTHLAHMAAHPAMQADQLTPQQMQQMEAVAMAAEWILLEEMEAEPDMPLPAGLDAGQVRIHLKLGLIERALRQDYDLQVHLAGQPTQDWLTQTQRRMGMLGVYRFAESFHGLPGFCASYLVGAQALLHSPQPLEVITGQAELDFFLPYTLSDPPAGFTGTPIVVRTEPDESIHPHRAVAMQEGLAGQFWLQDGMQP